MPISAAARIPVTVALTAPIIALLAVAACGPPRQTGPTPRAAPATPGLPAVSPVGGMLTPPSGDVNLPQTVVAAAQYAGDAACAECHPDIAHRYVSTDHARSLHRVTAQSDGRRFLSGARVKDSDSDTTYTLTVRGDRCLEIADGPAETDVEPAEVALGSGTNGTTYLGRDTSGQWYALRVSYYSRIGKWDFSPGLAPDPARIGDETRGQPLPPRKAHDCLTCHVSRLAAAPDGGPDLAATHPGVGCERCHGPAREHVASVHQAAAAGSRTFTHLEDLKHAAPARIQALCGACHNADFQPQPGDPRSERELARFQTTALSLSPCFQQSGALSCLNCHDPHANVSTDIPKYEVPCLRCHSSGTSHSVGNPQICKVNPRSGCIGCHMPVQATDSFPHTDFHNHWIRIWTKKSA